jgi:parallel beta-helix repeat protein
MVSNVARFGALVVLGIGVGLLPGAASAQTLSVAPTSINAQSSTGQNATSQTVTIKNGGGKALKWSIGAMTYDGGGNWLSVSPGRGTQGGNVVLTFQTSGMPAGSYHAWFGIESNGGSGRVDVQLSIAAAATPVLPPPPPPPTLLVSCPSNQSVASQDGKAVVVNYSATTSGGVSPITVTGNPASGTAFAVGTTPVTVTARSSDGQSVSCSFTVTVTYTAPAPAPAPAPTTSPSGVGPQSSITCPGGAVDVWPGTSIPNVVASFPGGTTFCVRAGVHYLTSAITPKTGDVFVGEFGAVLDGSNWATSDATQAAFRAHNQDIDYVTIRNFLIRNMPQRGIHAFYYMSDHWTVEYNEIASSANTGIVVPSDSLIRNNNIHHNTYAGYMGQNAHNTTFDSNEIAYNGWEQKIGEARNVTFRNNFAHHNVGAGIWFDSNNTGTLIEGNRVEDNGWIGVYYEISHDAIIRNNVLRRNADAGVMLSVSQNVEIYNNTFEYNFRGITFFLRCPSVGGATNMDLTNDWAHDNTILVGTQTNVFGSLFNYTSCTDAEVAPYLNGSKNLVFSRNTYKVPTLNGWYWLWGTTRKLWNEWQALGQDAGGTVGQ